MVALWIVLAVVVVAALATTVAVRTRRRGPVVEPPAPATPAPPVEAPPAPTPTATGREAEPPAAPPAPTAPAETAAPEAPEAAAPEVAAPALAPSFRDRLGRARGVFSGLRAIRTRGSVDPATWEELEDTLLRADVGVATAEALLADLRRRVQAGEMVGGDQLIAALRADLVDLLEVEDRWDAATDAELAADDAAVPPPDREVVAPVGRALRFDGVPGTVDVWLFVGVNGVGKTTTVGKVARQQADGRPVGPPGRRRHLPGGGRRAAGPVGRAVGGGDRPRGRGR